VMPVGFAIMALRYVLHAIFPRQAPPDGEESQ